MRVCLEHAPTGLLGTAPFILEILQPLGVGEPFPLLFRGFGPGHRAAVSVGRVGASTPSLRLRLEGAPPLGPPVTFSIAL